MTLQRRHFELIAETLRHVKEPTLGQTRGEIEAAHVQWSRTVGAFLGACEASNPNFNRARFLKACGVAD